MNTFDETLADPALRHDVHVSDERFHPDCAKCQRLREVSIRESDRRARHTGECPAHFAEYSESDCECGAAGAIEIRTISFFHGADQPATQLDLTGPAARGVVLALDDGRLVTIADLGRGPVIQVLGPDAEELATYDLPASAGVAPAEDTILCRLRGVRVPISECVSSCPAPEQRDVCAMEFDPTVSPQMAQYQAEGR